MGTTEVTGGETMGAQGAEGWRGTGVLVEVVEVSCSCLLLWPEGARVRW